MQILNDIVSLFLMHQKPCVIHYTLYIISVQNVQSQNEVNVYII